MKHALEVCWAENLVNMAIDQMNDPSDFPMLLNADARMLPELAGKLMVAQWPEHCVTKQHLFDANIFGPYETEEVASAAFV